LAHASRVVRCSAESSIGGATRMKVQHLNCRGVGKLILVTIHEALH
jgi:hypothetical protein